MNDALRILADRHLGVFSTADARRCGYDKRAIGAHVGRGEWHALRQGWYVERAVWDAAGSQGRHALRAHAVLLPVADRQVASHTTATVLRRLAHHRPDLRLVHTTYTDGSPGRTSWNVQRHQGLFELDECPWLGDVRLAPDRFSVAGSMLVADRLGALVVGDSALHRGLVTREQLREVACLWRHWTGARLLRQHVELLNAACASPGETATLDVFRLSREVPEPVLQHRIELPDGRVAYVDFAWVEQRVIVEFDGRVKYELDRRPGETSGDVVFREKRREDQLRELGWTVLRFTWADLQTPDRMVARLLNAFRRADR